MTDREQVIADIVARYNEWYGQESEYRKVHSGLWSGMDYGETVSHYMVREDVFTLLGLLGVDWFKDWIELR